MSLALNGCVRVKSQAIASHAPGFSVHVGIAIVEPSGPLVG
jgi:hypothetical protein